MKNVVLAILVLGIAGSVGCTWKSKTVKTYVKNCSGENHRRPAPIRAVACECEAKVMENVCGTDLTTYQQVMQCRLTKVTRENANEMSACWKK